MELGPLRSVIRELGLDSTSLAALSLATAHADPNIVTLVVPGGELAVNAWLKLRGALDRTGRWPIIAGEVEKATHELQERLESDPRPVADVLATVPTADPLPALREYERERRARINRFLESMGRSLPELSADEFDAGLPEEAQEQWPIEPANNTWTVHSVYDILKRTPLETCLLVLVPTVQPAEAPVYLRFGGFNECPAPEIHTAFMRDWGRRYGAVPACITRDVIECHVSRPPQTPDEARALAREQRVYCSDIVSQGTQTVERLAIELWRSRGWFFWWD